MLSAVHAADMPEQYFHAQQQKIGEHTWSMPEGS